MIKKRLLVIAALAISSAVSAFGQGSVYHTTIQNRIGQLVQGASITVCTTEPTGAACAGTTKATTYTDLTLGTPCTNVTTATGPTHGTGCTNPGLSDSLGNVAIYGPSSTTPEWMQITGYLITAQQIPFVLCSTGSVTSVAMTGDGTVLNSVVSGSPVITVGTLAPTLKTHTANTIFAGPTSGADATPTFRSIVPDDFGTQTANKVLAGPTSGGAVKPTFRALVTGDLPAGTGTVTSAGFTGDGVVYNASVTGSPITTSGSFAPSLHTQAANMVFAGPTTGAAAAPTFRSLVAADVPGAGVAIQAAATTSQSGNVAVGVSTDTTIISKSITMPNSGCPCRVFVAYNLWATSGAGLTANAWVTDGTDTFASTEGTASGAGINFWLTASSYSLNTYANGVTETFTVKAWSSDAFTADKSNPNGGSTQDSYLNTVVLFSN